MPAALAYTPDDPDLRKAAEAELLSRRTDCAKAWDYYDGRHKPQLKVKPGKVDDNVVINQWKQGKDREITFLFPKMPGFELDGNNDTESEDEKWLVAAWDSNRGKKMLRRLAKYGGMTGHIFARVMPAKAESGYPRIVALNPATTLVFWQADDYEQRLWYELYYGVGADEFRQDIVKTEAGWDIFDYKRKRKEQTSFDDKPAPWELVKETAWEFERGPIVDWQHIDRPGQFYGDNESSLLPLQDKVNKVASETGKILRFYASPKPVVQSDTEPKKMQDWGIDDAWLLPRDSEIKNLEMKSDLASSVAFGQMLVDAMKAQQRVVILSGSAADFQRVTNLGVQTVFIDQLAKTEELWEQYEPGIADLCRTMLCVGGKEWDRPIKATRSSPLPTDAKETMDVQKEELDNELVSKETIMRERGRNPQQERKLMDKESAGNDNALIRALGREAALTPIPSPARRGEPIPPQQPAQNGRP